MGNCLKLFTKTNKFSVNDPLPILILGLDGSGKTEIGHILCGHKRKDYSSTNGCNIFDFERNGVSIKLTEIGGSLDIRSIWPHYYNEALGIIFVVDASDYERVESASHIFTNLMGNVHLNGKPTLLLVNKQDLNGVLDSISICHIFNIENLANRTCTPCLMEGTSIEQKDGLEHGIQWLSQTILDNLTVLQTRNSFFQKYLSYDKYTTKLTKRPQTSHSKKVRNVIDRPNTAPAKYPNTMESPTYFHNNTSSSVFVVNKPPEPEEIE